MNTFWLKIAGLAIVVVGLIILVNVFSTSESEPKPKPKTFYDVAEEDDKRLRAEPKIEDIKQTQQPAVTEPKPQPVPKFKELSEIEIVEAERLFEFAMQQRKIGRLPVTGFKPMVDACREIMQKFPGSEFDYKARRMLADIPQRYRERYKITEEEIDLTIFFKEKHTNINSHNTKKKYKPRTSLSRSEWQIINADEKWMVNNMNRSGYKTYCTTLLNEQGTIDIVMTSGSFKNSASSKAIDDYIGAAVASVGYITSKAQWKSRKLIIKVGFGKLYEISTFDCRKCVELFNKQLYVEMSNYMFAHLREIKK